MIFLATRAIAAMSGVRLGYGADWIGSSFHLWSCVQSKERDVSYSESVFRITGSLRALVPKPDAK